jgi:DNA polymerase III delta prime subunit
MISKFNNEVLSKGPTAVLPQNLNHAWLNRLQKIAEEFLDQNFSTDECKAPEDIADPLLSVCVYEILRYLDIDQSMVPKEDMIEKMAIYAISIVMEGVNRESDIGLEPPGLDNILSVDRIDSIKRFNPAFNDLLDQACVIRDSSRG